MFRGIYNSISKLLSSRLPTAFKRWSTSSFWLFCTICLCLLMPAVAAAQLSQILCSAGKDGFTGKSRTGVTVSVGADSTGQFAVRSCAARLISAGRSVSVARQAAQIDLDMFDVTLGSGTPVAAFQIKQTTSACCMNYRAYSLRHLPSLLFSISGGSYFSAADTDLDGEIELWTDDAAVIDGFDGISLPEFHFLPTYVLRFSDRELRDVSSEFTGSYDAKIASIRAGIEPVALQQFLQSDGKLSPHGVWPAQFDHFRRLRLTKIAVLEIVWAYLYSGREQKAWQVLADMWPDSDRERIQQAIVKTRDQGMRRQFSYTLPEAGKPHKKKPATYSLKGHNAARPILLRFSQPFQGSCGLVLTIDAAGKVRSVTGSNPNVILPDGVLAAAATWKFIPGSRAGRSVASTLTMDVSLAR